MLHTLPSHILVEQARQGDHLAFERLFHETHAQIFNFLLGMGFSRDEADDLCQETYVRAWRSLGRLRSGSSFVAWLHQIARNAARDYLKYRRRRPEAPEDPAINHVDECESGPEASAEGRALERAVRDGIAKLPENQRLPIVMHHIEGLSVAEISCGLKVSYGTVLSRLARGRAALARRLAPFLSIEHVDRGNANVVQD